MKRFYSYTTGLLLLASLLLGGCDDKKKDYPTDYVGFERSTGVHYYDAKNKEETIEVKVIAIEKKKEDREIMLSTNKAILPGVGIIYKLTNDRITIKAGKKEATTSIILYPQRALKGQFISITCTPLLKDGQASKLSIELLPK